MAAHEEIEVVSTDPGFSLGTRQFFPGERSLRFCLIHAINH